jgi:hypothetical protein
MKMLRSIEVQPAALRRLAKWCASMLLCERTAACLLNPCNEREALLQGKSLARREIDARNGEVSRSTRPESS